MAGGADGPGGVWPIGRRLDPARRGRMVAPLVVRFTAGLDHSALPGQPQPTAPRPSNLGNYFFSRLLRSIRGQRLVSLSLCL